ncbi:ArsC family reductase [Crenothrix sp.]|uniref:ArsC family reductase n=1 Tax=Crenothrix sp. TaxID=3100433 RepID=UPI00374C9C5B
MHTLYGIKNCDTVKKARQWLDENAIAYRFHDYRVDDLSYEQLVNFEARLGWKIMLNRSSTSWRQLSDEQKTDITQATALQLMLAIPTLIKRPILQRDNTLLIGFKADVYRTELL